MIITAFKKSEDSSDFIIRLFEPTGRAGETTLVLPSLNIREKIKLTGFEIKTLRLTIAARTLTEVDLLEKPVTPDFK